MQTLIGPHLDNGIIPASNVTKAIQIGSEALKFMPYHTIVDVKVLRRVLPYATPLMRLSDSFVPGRILGDTEDKLRESNFQRQQLQKKTAFLEELNKDLQEVSEHNKKLESQLRRISEMESLLAKVLPEKKD